MGVVADSVSGNGSVRMLHNKLTQELNALGRQQTNESS